MRTSRPNLIFFGCISLALRLFLFLSLTVTFINMASDHCLYLRLLSYVKPYWQILGIGLLATALFSGVDAGATYLIKPLINEGFIQKKNTLIQSAPIVILVAFFLRSIANFVSSYAMTWVSRTVVMELRQAMFRKLLRLPATYFDNHASGHILSKLLYDVERVAQVSTDAITEFVQNFFFVLGLLIVMLSISWKLSCIYFSTVPFILMVVSAINQKMRQLSKTTQKIAGQVTEISEENINAYTVVRIFSGETYECDRFNKVTKKSRQYDLKLVSTRSLSVALVQLIASICIASIVYFAITPSYSTLLSAGGFASMIAAMLALLKPLKSLTKVTADLQKGLSGANSVFDFLDLLEEPSLRLEQPHVLNGPIEFKNIYFRYQANSTWVLRNISLKIPQGKICAFVGVSGSGKSTFVKLLARFYEPDSGKILINNTSIQTISHTALRSNIALVSQQVVLFNASIRENITYGLSKEIDEKTLISASKAAYAYEFIKKLPEGFDTVIGDNGMRLSGGQRQRIAIARAILKDAPILILDEATSALDTGSERMIQQALEKLMQHRTTCIIAHRLSTVKKSDWIVVLDDGIILEQGTHDLLLKKKGAYARLNAINENENNRTDPKSVLV